MGAFEGTPDDVPLTAEFSSYAGKRSAPITYTNDWTFFRQIMKFRDMYEFVLHYGVIQDERERHILASYASYASTRFHRLRGKPPTPEDWYHLSLASLIIVKNIEATGDSAVQSRYRLAIAPNIFFRSSVFFLICAMVGIFLAAGWTPKVDDFVGASEPVRDIIEAAKGLLCLMWFIVLGGLGAVASMYVNALMIQRDSLVDISSRDFIHTRIVLGAVFGLVLSSFILMYFMGMKLQEMLPVIGLQGPDHVEKAGFAFIIPFVLGFSASIVLDVMNKLTDMVRSVLGVADKNIGS